MPTPRWSSTTPCHTGNSRELFKNVLDGEATGVFQGKIIVQPRRAEDGRPHDEPGRAARPTAPTMNNKPELEIFADDVQCAHGATCGALDDDLLFYLAPAAFRSRRRRPLMLQAFVGEAIELVEDEAARPRRMSSRRRRAGRVR